jgi:hypothetical protein
MLLIGQQYELAPMSIFNQNKQATSTRPWWFSIKTNKSHQLTIASFLLMYKQAILINTC